MPSRRRYLGSSRKRFPAITAWPGIGASFAAPARPDAGGRYLLRFWAVDYLAEVWLNGAPVGGHEGGETPFVLDVTAAIRPGQHNLLAVRVLNPTHEPIDGIVLNQTAHRCKVMPYSAGAAFNHGGIVDSVELLLVPEVYLQNLVVRPDPQSGLIHVQVTVHNSTSSSAEARLSLARHRPPAARHFHADQLSRTFPPGASSVEGQLQLDNPHLWQLNDPHLYRVTVQRIQERSFDRFSELSTRCGFRDFRYADGYFRLNGHRVYLRGAHTCNHYPIGLQFPHDRDLLRRDLLNMKVMGFNAIRFIWGGAARVQLDLCDEIGLLVYEESYAALPIADSPQMIERFDQNVRELILRDSNHPSVVMWGLLNEAPDGPAFRHAVEMLPLVRALDETRVVMLNSGRYDHAGNQGIASVAGLDVWPKASPSEPWVALNKTDQVIKTLGITWAPGQLALHPGPQGEYSVVRWTSPADDNLEISTTFTSIAERATTDVHMLHNGRPLLDSFVNLDDCGNTLESSKTVEVKAGDTIDWVVGFGNGSYGADTTALAVKIHSSRGKTYDAAADFSVQSNPNGVWSYGQLAPGPTPDATTFAAYDAQGSSTAIGSISNPGSRVWEDVISDQHRYPRVPHTSDIIAVATNAGGWRQTGVSHRIRYRQCRGSVARRPAF